MNKEVETTVKEYKHMLEVAKNGTDEEFAKAYGDDNIGEVTQDRAFVLLVDMLMLNAKSLKATELIRDFFANNKDEMDAILKMYPDQFNRKMPEAITVDAENLIKVWIRKEKEADNPMHPGNIPEGHEYTAHVSKKTFKSPELGERFWIGRFSTSMVQEIIDDNTIRTLNSIYKWGVSK